MGKENELVVALREGVKSLRKSRKICKGDPIIITLGEYGVVYEGACTYGVDSIKDMNDSHCIIFAEPHGWGFVPTDLHCVKKERLSSRVVEAIQKKSTHNKIYKLGYCWVLKAKVILPNRK